MNSIGTRIALYGGMGAFLSILSLILFISLSSPARGANRDENSAKPHLAASAATSQDAKKSAHPTDDRKVTRYVLHYSRGNDDSLENSLAKGVYETAKMEFVVVARQGNAEVELWLELKPMLTNSQVQGAQVGSRYGAMELTRQKIVYLNETDQIEEQKRLVEEQKKEKGRFEAEQQRMLLSAERELREVREKIKSAKKFIENLELDIAKGKKGKSQDQNTGFLEKVLTREKSGLGGHLSDERAVENLLRSIKVDSFTERNIELPSRRMIGFVPQGIFNPFEFKDKEFARTLNTPAVGDPAGKAMKSTVYLGKYSVSNTKERLEGIVGLLPSRESQSPTQTVKWLVDLEAGQVKTAISYPEQIPGRMAMWKFLSAEIHNPDNTISPFQLNIDPEKGFMKKPESLDRKYSR